MSIFKRGRSPGAALSLAIGITLASAALAEENSGAVDTVVVTGSYIKRDNFDLSSPISVVNSESIAETGAPNVGETLYNETFNFGVSRVQNFLSGSQITNSEVTLNNLRGLGTGATLELMNGKLSLAGNANYTYPQMAIQRVETLLDGASALYGSQAVAGVVNYVPYTKFEGLRTMVDARRFEAAPRSELVAGLMAGLSGEHSHFVFAFETRHRDPVYSYDLPYIVDFAGKVGQGYSGTGNPGSFRVPVRNSTGAITTTAPLPDPGCGNQINNPGSRHSIPRNDPNGIVSGTNCLFSFQEFWDYDTKLDQQLSYTHFDYDFTDRFRFKGELVYNRSTSIGRGSPINSGASGATIVQNMIGGKIPGEHPGNPYRAMNSTGAPLFASDICTAIACAGVGDGVPDRDLNGDGVITAADAGAERNVKYNVVLSTTPLAAGPNSIPFNEDVTFNAWRALGKSGQLIPTANNKDYSAPIINKFTFTRYNSGLEWDVGKSWTVNLDYTFNNVLGVTTGTDASLTALAAGLTGKLGPNQNQWFNPFDTANWLCVNRVCGGTPTPSTNPAYNSQFVIDQVIFQSRTTSNTYSHVGDLVAATNDLFALPAGNVGLAIGAQYLISKEDFYSDSHFTQCDAWATGCLADFRGQRTTEAAFFEAQIPVLKNLDLNAAGRYTVVGDKDGNFNPKLGLVYKPFSMLSLRGSWGTSYIAPSLRQEQYVSTSNINTTDPTCTYSGGRCNASIAQFVLQRQPGNPQLENETSHTVNLGFTLRMLNDDLTLQGDWVDITYKNRITPLSPQAVLTGDLPNYINYVKTFCGVTDPALASAGCQGTAHDNWVAHAPGVPLEDSRIVRASGLLSSVDGGWFNASEVETSQIDMQVRYGFDIGKAGRMNVGVSGTYIDKYDVQASAGAPKISKAGKANTFESYPALPRLRLQPRVNWNLGDHNVTLLGYYHSSVYVSGSGATEVDVPSAYRFNLAYTLTLHKIFSSDKDSTLTFGALNVTDKKPYLYNTAGGYNSYLDDPLGRQWYARFVHDF